MGELEVIEDKVTIDWRDILSYRPPIRSQDRTSACNAFATTSIIEYWKGKGFSVQHLLDLAPEQKPKPGFPPEYLKFNIHEMINFVTEQGICLERNHRPLDWERQPSKCNRQCHRFAFERVRGDDRYDENKMIAALMQRGPFIGSIHATTEFCNWRGDKNNGIFVQKKVVEKSDDPDKRIPKHAIAVIGYGYLHRRNVRTGKSVYTNYMIIHNSWDETWGERGYAKVRTSGENDGVEEEFLPIKFLYIPNSENRCGRPYIPKGGVVPVQESEDEDLGSSYLVSKRPPMEQQQIQRDISGVLIDRRLVEVAEEYRLVPEMLFLAVNYIDCYLSGNAINRNSTTRKYEEVCPLKVEDFCYITDITYCKDEVPFGTRTFEKGPSASTIQHRGSPGDTSCCLVLPIYLVCDSWDRSIPRINTLFQKDRHTLAYEGGVHTFLEMGRGDDKLMDPQFCAKIACDIYDKLRMAEVAEEYMLVPETLFLAVNHIDRYLSGNAINRPRIQLVGVTCMMLAAKYEEVEDFCYITDNTYCKDKVLQMESEVLDYLKCEMTSPTAYSFLSGVTGFLLCSKEAPDVKEAGKQNSGGTITGLMLFNK